MAGQSFIPKKPRKRRSIFVPVNVVEVLEDGHQYIVNYQGQRHEMLSQGAKDTTLQLTEGEWALGRLVGGKVGDQIFYPSIRIPKERLWYGLPTVKDGDGNHEATLWAYDGLTHSAVFTTSSGWDASNFGETWITLIFYLPVNNTLYFVTHQYDGTISFKEEDKLYKVNIVTLAVTQISVAFDNNTNSTDPDDVREPSIDSVAYFKGKVYLGQMGADEILEAGGDDFHNRVYRFDQSAETLTKVFEDADHPLDSDVMTSLAVQGSDAELLYADYENVAANGKIYSTTDGDSWSLLTTIDSDAEIIDMMTDRATGDVYIECGGRSGLFADSIYRYTGSVPAVEEIDLNAQGTGWLATSSLGARYVGNARQELWHVNGIDRTVGVHGGDNDALLRTASWNEATEDINDLLTSGYSNPSLPGLGQSVSSFRSELIFMCIEDVSPRAIQIIVRHEGSPWTLLRDMGFSHETDTRYGRDAAIIRAPSLVLPHES